VVLTLYVYGMTLICSVVVQFVSDSLQSTLCVSSALWFLEDGCSLQSKHVIAVKPIVQLVINLCVSQTTAGKTCDIKWRLTSALGGPIALPVATMTPKTE